VLRISEASLNVPWYREKIFKWLRRSSCRDTGASGKFKCRP